MLIDEMPAALYIYHYTNIIICRVPTVILLRVNVRLVLNVMIICTFLLECTVVQMARGVSSSLWPLSP